MAALGTFTLTGTYLNLDSSPQSGKVRLDGIPQVIVDGDGDKVYLGPRTLLLDEAGRFSVDLPTDAAAGGADSTTIGYRVRFGTGVPVEFYAPAATATLDMADVTPQSVETPAETAVNAARAEAAADAADTSAGQAASSATAAEQAAASVPATTDAAVTPLVPTSSGSSFSQALNAAYAAGVNLPKSNGTDDTTAIQNLLDSAAAFSKTPRVFGHPGETYLTSAPLVVSSNTTLDMTGCTVRRISGTQGLMLHNAAMLGTGAYDENITIVGGTWDKNGVTAANSRELHNMVIHRANNVEVRDCRYLDATTNSKYCLLFVDVNDYRARNLFFDNVPSDGVHVNGPATNGHLSGLRGVTRDDFVGVCGNDYPGYVYTDGGGDITGLVIDGVTYEGGGGSGILLLAGSDNANAPHTLSHVTVRNIHGTVSNFAMRIQDDTLYAATTGGITDDVTVEQFCASSTNAAYGINVSISSGGVTAGGRIGTIRFRDIAYPDANGYLQINAAKADSITVDGLSAMHQAAITLVDVKPGASVDKLTVRNARVTLDPTKSNGRLVYNQATVGTLTVDDIYVEGGAQVVQLGGTTRRVNASRWYFTNVGIPLNVQGNNEVPKITAWGIASDVTNFIFAYVAGSSATATLSGGQIYTTSNAIQAASTQVVRCNGMDLYADITKLTPQQGDVVRNRNASAGPLGVVTYDAYTWRALQGYTDTGTATLAAGTVTVARTKTTNNTRVKLFTVTPAGTVGAPFVSARTAGTGFTISSTSASDTSTIRWEVVQD